MFETSKELSPFGGSASSGLSQLSLGLQRQTRREVERVQTRAIVAKLTEDGRAFLTHTALEHVGALTALEQHLITVAPLGEARYREIVDSYTLGAAAAIRRWS
ncbi:hypothetical protein [Microbacterium sp. B24]|uniref:hypothetical protein n=1 Tax=Microbacterium sp. B24 TaxID=95616 RepID=UPI0003FDF198|nr:hypothetical protein [Microbacterium sp. B24]